MMLLSLKTKNFFAFKVVTTVEMIITVMEALVTAVMIARETSVAMMTEETRAVATTDDNIMDRVVITVIIAEVTTPDMGKTMADTAKTTMRVDRAMVVITITTITNTEIKLPTVANHGNKANHSITFNNKDNNRNNSGASGAIITTPEAALTTTEVAVVMAIEHRTILLVFWTFIFLTTHERKTTAGQPLFKDTFSSFIDDSRD